MLISFASMLQKHLPRGKGSVPRWLGRKAIRAESRYMTTRHGAKLVLAASSLDVYATMRIGGNAWDYEDFQVCYEACPDGGIFYDVGANVGYFAIEMAQITGQKVEVCAFEPQPSLAAAINASISLNRFSGVRLFNSLVGDGDRPADLYVAPSSIHASAVDDSGRGATHKEASRMVTLDGLLGVPPPDMIKIDVEGAEHLVLRGAHLVLRSHKPHMFLEYLPNADPDLRIRREVQRLLADVSEYRLYGDPQSHLRSNYSHKCFRMRDEDDWENVGAVFLRNMDRPLRSSSSFEP